MNSPFDAGGRPFGTHSGQKAQGLQRLGLPYRRLTGPERYFSRSAW